MAGVVKPMRSVSRRFSSAIISVVAVIIVFSGIFSIVRNITTLESELQQRVTMLSKLAEKSLAIPLKSLNHAFLNDFLNAVFSEPTLVYARISANNETVAIKTTPELAQKEWRLLTGSSEFMTKETAIYSEGKAIGAIELAVSKETIRRQTRLNIYSTCLLAAILIGAIAITSMLVTEHYIRRPLSTIVNISAKISNGELDANFGESRPVEKKSQDEIMMLDQEFRVMLNYLQHMATAATHLSLGDLRQHITPRSDQDVLGKAFQRMIEYLNYIGDVAARISQGDLGQQIEIRSSKDQIGAMFMQMAAGLVSLISSIRVSSEQIAAISTQVFEASSKNAAALEHIGESANETSFAMQQVYESSEEVRHNNESLNTTVRNAVASIVQMLESITQVAEHSRKLSQFADETTSAMLTIVQSLEEVTTQADHSRVLSTATTEDARIGQQSVEAMMASMQTISDVTTHISEIVFRFETHSTHIDTILDVVYEIAEHTSLLALNASIIAAQAGSQGRGFAVVADEIKELAIRVRLSVKEISDIVKAVQKDSGAAVKAIQQGQTEVRRGVLVAHQAEEALNKIRQSAENSAKVAADIATLVRQQASTHAHITDSIREVSEMIAHITQATRQQEKQSGQLAIIMENIQELGEHVLKVTQEQQRSTQHVAQLMTSVTSLVEENTAMVQQFAVSSQELASHAETLKQHVERFTIPASRNSLKT